MYQIEIRHNFETAHRLLSPGSPVKCMSIHGHSWWVTVTIEGPSLDDNDLLVEFGGFKKAWRGFLDTQIDHHLVLHVHDPMAEAVRSVYPESRLLLLPANPTTEVLARWLHTEASRVLVEVLPHGVVARIGRVHVQETQVNAASFRED